MRITASMIFFDAMLLPFKYCPMNVLINLVEFQLKPEVISIISLRMRIISAIMNFYLCHVIAFEILSHERSDKFS